MGRMGLSVKRLRSELYAREEARLGLGGFLEVRMWSTWIITGHLIKIVDEE